jgi:biotin operon repressor
MHLSGMMLVDAALPQDFDRSIVLLVVMRVCAPDWTAGGRLCRPASPTRFTSVNAIALSLQRSPETIRRHVQALLNNGICVRGAGGIALNPDPAVRPDLLSLYTAYHDLLVGFVEDLAALGVLPPSDRAPAETLLAAIVQTTLDIALIPFEQFGPIFDDWASMRVWACIGALNVRHIMLDPVLNARYAVASTPNALRQPVLLRTVQRTLGMPYATVWRHCRALEAQGLVVQVEQGWLIGVAQLRDDAMEEQVVAAVLYYLRRVGGLIAAGFDPARVTQSYLAARPPLAPIG